MKNYILGFIFIIWIITTSILMLSVVGWIILIKINDTKYYKYGAESRTVWMQFGYELKEYFINI